MAADVCAPSCESGEEAVTVGAGRDQHRVGSTAALPGKGFLCLLERL
ncbi:MAG: hypothetical protein R3F11_19735 [Verrucomicrobiales bacterium]